MSTARVFTRANAGMDAPLVRVEVHLSPGLPAFTVVGLPESSVREARERVRSAVLTSHFMWPDSRIVVNLAPAELPKGGGRFDLPMALGVLAASDQLPKAALEGREFFGELGLDGGLRPTPALLAAVTAATRAGHACFVPGAQAQQLAVAPGSRVIAGVDLLSVAALARESDPATTEADIATTAPQASVDLADIAGQAAGKRILEVAAAGGHHLLFRGPPGAGKTLLASALPGLLPLPDRREQLDMALLADLSGQPPVSGRQFRAPHHSASAVALVGGGPRALPGEISLAHGGVLFLDELAEFPRAVLDQLRQPLEAGEVVVSRARYRHRYPAAFQLVAATNPCPCGHAGPDDTPCRCAPEQVRRYQARLSGPLLDRIDLHLALERQPTGTVLHPVGSEEDSATVRRRVETVRLRQLARQGCLNVGLPARDLQTHCRLEPLTGQWFEAACERLALSARAVHRCLRVARTLADMADAPALGQPQLLEALTYRPAGPGLND